MLRKINVQNEFIESFNNACDYVEKNNLISDHHELQVKKNELEALTMKSEILIKTRYMPVYDVLVERFGDVTATFLLSKTYMRKLASDEVKFEDIPFPYRKELFKSIIQEKGIEAW